MNKFKLTILTLILLVFGLVVSGCVKKPQESNTNVVPAQAGIQESEVDTSDWKTYRNEEYGFEFKYPVGWKVESDEGRVTIWSVQRLSLSRELYAPDVVVSNYFEKSVQERVDEILDNPGDFEVLGDYKNATHIFQKGLVDGVSILIFNNEIGGSIEVRSFGNFIENKDYSLIVDTLEINDINF